MKNIYRTACWIACLLCCVHTLCGKNVEGDVNYVLIINTYTESTPWSNSMIYPIVSMASQDEKLGVYTEHMNMLMMDGEEELAAFEKNIFKDFETRPPKLIVLLGTASFILCEDLDRQWPDIPIILCGERDYAGNKDMVLKKQPLTPEERMPLTAWQGKYNMTSMPIQVYFEENLDLMKRLIPGMKEVLYIGDETYICQQNDYDLKHLMESGYPELKYRFLCSRDIGIDSLFTILNQIDVRTTGILFSSWFQKRVYAGNTVLYANSHRIIATSSVPLFSFKNVGIEEEGGIIGGFIYNKTDYVAHLCETIREIIGGRQARDIPFYYGPKGTPVFNYQSLLQRNLDPELCPPGTVFYNMPPTFWEKYKYILIGIGFLLVGVLLIFQYHRLRVLEKIKMIQRRELQANERYLDLIDNMPILYMHEELIKDAEGKVVDTRYLDINRYFENNFFKREEIIGKLGSEVFPESMP